MNIKSFEEKLNDAKILREKLEGALHILDQNIYDLEESILNIEDGISDLPKAYTSMILLSNLVKHFRSSMAV